MSFFVFPNRESGGISPTFIFHQVARCLPTKDPLLFFPLWLLRALGGSLTREPSLEPTLLQPHTPPTPSCPLPPGHPFSEALIIARLRLQALRGPGASSAPADSLPGPLAPPVMQVMPGPLHPGSALTPALSPPAAVLVPVCTRRPLLLRPGGRTSACLSAPEHRPSCPPQGLPELD